MHICERCNSKSENIYYCELCGTMVCEECLSEYGTECQDCE